MFGYFNSKIYGKSLIFIGLLILGLGEERKVCKEFSVSKLE